MRKILAAVLLPALLLAGCTTRRLPPPAVAASPAVWKVADADTTIYLFGTIHVLPAGYDWRRGPVREAIERSDALVLETVLGPDPTVTSALIARLGRAGGLPPLRERVAADKRKALSAMIARSGMPPAMLDGMKTWAAALMLVGATLNQMKLAAGNGVEPQLEAGFAGRGLPVTGLETPAEQLGFFDGLPEEAQREFLGTMVENADIARRDYEKMLAAWARGDAAEIAATFSEDLKASPALREALLVRRNANWAEWIRRRLDRPGTVMVAVGAAHLVGRGSVQSLLEKDGVRAERLP